MKQISTSTIALLISLFPLFLQADPLRILPLGDSITQGRAKASKTKPATYSYRYPLWKMLIDREVDFDFIGSIEHGFDSHHNGDPDYPDYQGHSFDKDHEGHWGWRTDQILGKLPGWLEEYTPDITLLLLGTNDTRRSSFNLESTLDNMRSIIALLRKDNPEVMILLGLPFQGYNEHFDALREAYPKLAEEVSTKQSPVIIVDHSKGWTNPADKPSSDTVDNDHPNQQGDLKLAQNWMEAIKPFVVKSHDN